MVPQGAMRSSALAVPEAMEAVVYTPSDHSVHLLVVDVEGMGFWSSRGRH